MWSLFKQTKSEKPVSQKNSTMQSDFAKRFQLAAQLSAEMAPQPSPEPDQSFAYTPLEVKNTIVLASTLETILQGQKVPQEFFLNLYRGGYVFKETGGNWKITEKGKQLIEKHKLLCEDITLINGVPCKKRV